MKIFGISFSVLLFIFIFSCKNSILIKTAANLDIMDQPALNSKIIGSLAKGELVSVISTDSKTVMINKKSGNWVQIKLKPNDPVVRGWVFSGNLTCDSNYKNIIFQGHCISPELHKVLIGKIKLKSAVPPNDEWYFYSDNTCKKEGYDPWGGHVFKGTWRFEEDGADLKISCKATGWTTTSNSEEDVTVIIADTEKGIEEQGHEGIMRKSPVK